jgi:hypothetical protein
MNRRGHHHGMRKGVVAYVTCRHPSGGAVQVFRVQEASQSQQRKASRSKGGQSIAMKASKSEHCPACAGHGIGAFSHYRLLVRAVVVRPSVGGSKLPIWPQIALPYYPNIVTINLQ